MNGSGRSSCWRSPAAGDRPRRCGHTSVSAVCSVTTWASNRATELRDLEQAILLGKPTLDPAPSRTASSASPVLARDAAGRRFDVPSPLTRFVGRATERRDIARHLTASRLVTLTGMGGVGKTRLALEVAADVQDDYADGVWLFELAPARGETAVLAAVARTFGLTVSELAPPVEQICRYLAGRHALLLFDNCEHVLDAVAALVETILRDAQSVRVLATSRELLRAAGRGHGWRCRRWRCPTSRRARRPTWRPRRPSSCSAIAPARRVRSSP